ncbi:MAG TPA: helix-turn-helix transcriptional regulator [Longimicrobium sp.]
MSRKNPEEETTRFERGSGNVFADLGLPEPEGALAKARLAQAIAETIDRRGLTQEEAAKIMGLDQPKVSAIVRGRLAGFTQDRLTRCVLALGNDVEITIRSRAAPAAAGHLAVTLV